MRHHPPDQPPAGSGQGQVQVAPVDGGGAPVEQALLDQPVAGAGRVRRMHAEVASHRGQVEVGHVGVVGRRVGEQQHAQLRHGDLSLHDGQRLRD